MKEEGKGKWTPSSRDSCVKARQQESAPDISRETHWREKGRVVPSWSCGVVWPWKVFQFYSRCNRKSLEGLKQV